MSNYLPEIENEYSCGRGEASRLSPMDWQVAENLPGVESKVLIRKLLEKFELPELTLFAF